MINEHLLKKGLSLNEVEVFAKTSPYRYVKKLPKYTIACCPFCQEENIEHLDTYTLTEWNTIYKAEPREDAFPDGRVFHCEHFVVAQTFVFVTKTKNPYVFSDTFFDNLISWALGRPNQNFFVPQKPMVLGFVLKNQLAKAVLHVLPICEYTEGDFVPAHLLYIITHFSERPEEAYQAIQEEARSRAGDDGWPTLTRTANYGEEGRWFKLSYWVERGLLYWVNPYAIEDHYDPEKCLLTGDVAAFPYKNPRKLMQQR